MAKAFIKELDSNSVLVVDAINLAFRYKHSKQKEYIDSYIATVHSLARSYGCSKVIIASDQGSSTYRKEIFPEYKQNRKDKIAEQSEEEKEEFAEFFQEFENLLEAIEYSEVWPVLRFQGVEADDIAAYLAKQKEHFGIEKLVLVSSDKDWDLLVRDGVSRFSYVTRKDITLDNWEETHKDGYSQDQYLSIKCLQGDKKDNVPGITGIGAKRAFDLIETYGSAMDVYDNCPIDSRYKYIQNLNDNYEQILINYELLDLLTYCEEAIGQDNLEEINKIVSEYMSGPI